MPDCALGIRKIADGLALEPLHRVMVAARGRFRELQLFCEYAMSLPMVKLTQGDFLLADRETKSALNLHFSFIFRGVHFSTVGAR